MALRHRNKKRIANNKMAKLAFASEVGTRIAKIDALTTCGRSISRKANTPRVNAAFEKLIVEYGRIANEHMEERNYRNRKKRERKRK